LKKVIYIISDIDKALAFEWIAQQINKDKFLLSFILLNPGASVLEDYLRENNIDVHQIQCRGKKDWPGAIFKTYSLLKKAGPDIVHCHLLQANIIGLIAAKLAGIKKRIYTRHHSSLHHEYFPKGVWWDKLSNKLATHIIAISGTVKRILVDWENADVRKIVLIPHGFVLKEFKEVENSRIEAFRQKHSIPADKFIVGVISRFTEWKGIQYTIPAFQNYLKEKPDAILLLLNAQGDYEQNIKQLLATIPSANYRLITFENDIAVAYKAMNIFVHVPIDEHSEAFGQVYVEALAAGVPAIFTMSGIAADFIVHKENAYVVTFKNVKAIEEGLMEIGSDTELQQRFKERGWNSIRERFDISIMIKKLEGLYAGE
jgi:glycosyltransferase involved in cell wall biosynthesis